MSGANGTGCVINATELKKIAAEKKLKQWWIAEQLGVHRKTVVRWMNGRVRRTTPDLARALSELLGCSLDRIIVTSEAELFATVSDQKAAAEILRTSTLMDRLGPAGEWDTVETVLKAVLLSDLPADAYGDLLNNLSIACWRQSKIPQASAYAERAREVGDRAGRPSVYANALLNIANIQSWNGRTLRALNTYRECLSYDIALEPRRLGAALNNTAAVLWEAGRTDESIRYLDRAIRVFAEHGRGMNRSIAHAQRAIILLEKGEYTEALSSARLARGFAEQDHYGRGRQTAILIEAEAHAAEGRFASARDGVRSALEKSGKPEIMEPLIYEIAARALRRSGYLDEAQTLIDRGLTYAHGFPVSEAALLREQGLVRAAAGHGAGARNSWSRARHLYARCGASERVRQLDGLIGAQRRALRCTPRAVSP
jgi:tetratricopeptide (TPR) repeat protein/DNA-binding XRE family transcriptional regulator